MGGDLNLVIDPQKDSLHQKSNNSKACEMLKMYVSEAMLVDVWRQTHPDKFEFTYKKRNSDTFAHLDYLFVNQGMFVDVRHAKHIPSYRSDHNAVTFILDLGPGFWKLNESIPRTKRKFRPNKQNGRGYDTACQTRKL